MEEKVKKSQYIIRRKKKGKGREKDKKKKKKRKQRGGCTLKSQHQSMSEDTFYTDIRV